MLCLGLLALAAAEEPQFSPELQVRPRLEAHTGRDGASGGEDLFVSQRARLGATLSLGPVSAHAVVQDVRIWGEELNTLKDWTADGLDLHVAELTWKPSDQLALTVGRQEWNIHEQRLIGSVDWTQQGRSFDAARLWAKTGDLSMDLGAGVLASATAAPQAALGRDKDAALALLRAGWSPKDGPTVDLLYVLDADGWVEQLRHTAGIYAKGATGALSGRVEAYVQAGAIGDTSISAYLAGVSGTWASESSVKPSVTLWYDLLSGDEDPTDDVARAFNTLFATNHKFYGQLDLMNFVTAGAVDGRGLHDAALKLAIAPMDGWKLNLDGHFFMAAAAQGGDAALGEEADLWLSGRLAPKLNLGLGAAAFLPADDADPDAWGWLQLEAKL